MRKVNGSTPGGGGGGGTGKFLVEVCCWDSEPLTLNQTTSILQPYSRLIVQKTPTLSKTNYLLTICKKYSVFNRNHLSINKVAVVQFTFISEFFKPYLGLIFSHHLSVSR